MFTSNDNAAHATRELIALLSISAGRRCLLLLDPVLRPPEVEAEEGPWQHYCSLAHTPVPLTHPNADPSHYAVLTTLRLDDEADRALLVHTVQEACTELMPLKLRQGQGRRIAGWIVTDAPVDDVAMHLGDIMLQRHPSGRSMWLRLHDPAVLWVLSGWLQPSQLSALVGPIGRIGSFSLLTPAGQLLTLQAQEAASHQGLALTAAQWAAIDCIQPLNTALRNWGDISPQQLRPARSIAFAAIRRAKAMGFEDSLGLALYGHYALSVHARFDFHPLVSSRLRARLPGDHFGAVIADLSPADWERIAREAPAPEAT